MTNPTIRPSATRSLLFTLPLLLSSCQTISDGADHLGSYMPTIGERCYHWQCFTSEGQRISERNRVIEEGLPTQPPTTEKPPTPQGAHARSATASPTPPTK